MNRLYYGDNLHILRDHVASESVDLIYLDPPFNSNASYNILFRSPSGAGADAQIEAFGDTWAWGPEAEDAFHQVVRSGRTRTAELIVTLRTFLGDNAMMAYLAMMAVRLLELHRVLKPTGSLYLHCDPTASHYLKLVLDGVFGPDAYQAEIIWRRTNARSTAGKWPRLHDIVLHYSKSRRAVFHAQSVSADEGRVPHTLITGVDGRKYNTFELTGAGVTKDGESGRPWRGFDPGRMGRHWANSAAQRDAWAAENLIHFPSNGGFPRRRAVQPFEPGERKVTVGDVWTDIDRLNQTARERLGYPTQKPVALLERIVAASSNPGDVVLDPFCGCGTAVHAAEKLGRRWIGIDITHLAVSLIERRMKDAFEDVRFEVIGRPQDLASAQELARRDKHEFQKWVVTHIGGQPWRGGRKGADGGIDGLIWFTGIDPETERTREEKAIISVKGGQTRGPGMVAELVESIQRNGAAIGILVMAALPTREMEKRAAAAGMVDFGLHARVPRIQILTLAEIFAGRRPNLPNIDRAIFRAARRETATVQTRLL